MADLAYKLVEPRGSIQGTVIALHGRGSHPDDLLGLTPYFGDGVRVVAPAGPMMLGTEAYAWYDMEARGTPLEPGFSEHLNLLARFVTELSQRFALEPERTVVLGFSQGAVMSYALARLMPQAFSGVVALSGYLPEPGGQGLDWTPLAPCPVMATHGTVDPTIPVELARYAGKALAAAGVAVTYREYPMGHHVTPESMRAVSQWLQARWQS